MKDKIIVFVEDTKELKNNKTENPIQKKDNNYLLILILLGIIIIK